MAVWQYDAALVPKAGVIRHHGQIPTELSEYRAVWDPDDEPEQNFPNYWDGGPSPESIASEIERILPPITSWSEDLLLYGSDTGNRIEIWKSDGINIRCDLRNFDINFLDKIIDFALKHDLLIVSDTEGRPMEPSRDNLISDIKISDAYRFCCDPKGFLTSLKTEKERTRRCS